MLGDDIVALCDAQPPRILKGEAKSKRALNETTVQQADKALNARDGRPKSETLAFLSMRLREHQHDELAECVESFLDDVDDDQIEHLLFTFSGNDGRDVLAQYAQSERPRIRRRVAGVVVTDHQEFIADVFNNVRKAMSG
jgi:hypothetical protein